MLSVEASEKQIKVPKLLHALTQKKRTMLLSDIADALEKNVFIKNRESRSDRENPKEKNVFHFSKSNYQQLK